VRRRSDPLWARLFVIFGALLMVASGVVIAGGRYVLSRYTAGIGGGNFLPNEVRNDNHGEVRPNQPVNVLLLGLDTRPNNGEPIRSDSIIILHIPKTHDRAYLVSIPRDLRVDIPPFPPIRHQTVNDRINAAFPFGSRDGRDIDAGVQLMSLTIHKLVGIKFDAGATIDFEGFRDVVQAMDGIDMCVDQRTESIHVGLDKNGHPRAKQPGDKPVIYEVGCRHFAPWAALDYVRQRHLNEGDYARQRHQQQFLKAIFHKALSRGMISDPLKLDAVIKAAGKALRLDTGGIDVAEWLWAMKGIGEGDLVMLKTAGHSVFNNPNDPNSYQGEALDPAGRELFDALRDDKLDEFQVSHPELVNSD
jgi:LCP family protein required for cell wall assembly